MPEVFEHQLIYKGKIKGTATSSLHFSSMVDEIYVGHNFLFSIKVDEIEEEVPGLPENLSVFITSENFFIVEPGDIIKVDGRIIKSYIEFWDAYKFRLEATHVYNVTRTDGF